MKSLFYQTNKVVYLRNTNTVYDTISPEYGLEYNKALWYDAINAYVLICFITDPDKFLIFQLTYPEYIIEM